MRFYRARAAGAECGASQVLTSLTNSGEPADSQRQGLTLTPTTLRNIEETFMEVDGGHQHQAGFVTPQVTAGVTYSQLDQHRWQGGVTTVTAGRHGGGVTLMDVAPRSAPQGHRRGGRRPKDDDVPPEEEQRRRMRRERNKQAAARCRQRRVTLTNTLQQETDELEQERSALEQEIRELQAQREELHFLMEAHRPCCQLGKENAPRPAARRAFVVKQEPEEATVPQAPLQMVAHAPSQMVPQASPQAVPQAQAKQARPTSLSLTSLAASRASTAPGGPGVAINTPSHGLGLNFDSLMEGGTGLTPITSTGLTPLLLPQVSAAGLATPVVSSQGDLRRGDMLSPGDRHLVSL